jgi:hypothetical protein
VSTWELTGVLPPASQPFAPWSYWAQNDFGVIDATQPIAYETQLDDSTALPPQRRLIERVRTLYRSDDLQRLLPLGELQPRALPGESYQLAFTRSLIEQIYQRDGQALLPDPAVVLGSPGADGGGYVTLSNAPDAWWQPSGRIHYHPDPVDAAAELAEAVGHFFLPRRYRDAFGQDSQVDYDRHQLLLAGTRDAVVNRVRVAANDYRVLQPRLITDPNGSETEVAFDALGLVVGTAVMGRASEQPRQGDRLDELFRADLSDDEIRTVLATPRVPGPNPAQSEPAPLAQELLAHATTRIVYRLQCDWRQGEPPVAATIAREVHVSDLKAAPAPDGTIPNSPTSPLQISLSYSDGFGREIQKKIQAEPGPVPLRDANGTLVLGADGQPRMTDHDVRPRWVGSGWTVFNNKGKPVRAR